MVPEGLGATDLRLALDLKGDECLSDDTFKEAPGETPVGIFLDEIEIGFNNLEFDGGRTAVKDEYVHMHLSEVTGKQRTKDTNFPGRMRLDYGSNVTIFVLNLRNLSVKKLLRSPSNRLIAGVCGGIGEMLNADPVAVRLLALLLALVSGILPFVIVYIIAWIIVPEGRGVVQSGPFNRN